jgi:hypothetical protein
VQVYLPSTCVLMQRFMIHYNFEISILLVDKLSSFGVCMVQSTVTVCTLSRPDFTTCLSSRFFRKDSLWKGSTVIIIIIKTSLSPLFRVHIYTYVHTYIPETNHVPKEYRVAAILSLLFMASISLIPSLVLMYFYISTFRSMCAVPTMAVF